MSVKVFSVEKDSYSAAAGIRGGDVLVAINGTEIFDVLDYYLFNEDKIEDTEKIAKDIHDLSFKLLISIDDLRKKMFEDCLEDCNNHDYMNRLDLIIRFLSKKYDLSNLITVKNILEEDFAPTYDEIDALYDMI